jgi:hypothetical protein
MTFIGLSVFEARLLAMIATGAMRIGGAAIQAILN